MSDQVKLAIIGCGGIAGGHLNSYQKLQDKGYDRFRVAAVCDVAAENVERYAADVEAKLGHRPDKYGSVEETLAAANLDAADICLPHAYHHTAAIACLEAGLDVMVEKPVGITIKAGRMIIETARQNGRILATAEQVRRDHLVSEQVATVVIQDSTDIMPAPPVHEKSGQVGLPQLMDPGGFTPKLSGRLDHFHLRWGHQAVKLQNPVDAALRDAKACLIGDLTGQLPTA